jgi:hypothetical protein
MLRLEFDFAVYKEQSNKEDFEKMFSPGPVQTKGLVNLMISYPNPVFHFLKSSVPPALKKLCANSAKLFSLSFVVLGVWMQAGTRPIRQQGSQAHPFRIQYLVGSLGFRVYDLGVVTFINKNSVGRCQQPQKRGG